MTTQRADARKRTEAGSRADRIVAEANEQRAAERERRREITRDALTAIMSGASFLDADAFLDHLDDLGGWVGVRA